jgi:tetratricopeptide (TPR) repeat protein
VRKKTVLQIFGTIVLLNILFGIAVLIAGCRHTSDVRLEHEALAIPQLKDVKYLFYTPGSHADLAAARPDLVALADEHAYAQAVQMPTVFRRLDHQRQFDALLLAGDPTTYKPLLRHLGESRDFVLVWLDNATLIFRRNGARHWTEADLHAAAEPFKGDDRARFLAGAARRLIAVGQLPIAHRALDEAQPLGQKVPEMWTVLALYEGQIAHWPDALESVDKALKLDPDFTPALATKADIMMGAKRLDEALAISDKVIEKNPDDPSMLFLHATISHQAHAFQREVAALKHLIDLADAQGISTTGYRIYLGQAYAESGDAVGSMTEFKKVLGAEDASPEQKKFAQECIEKIGEKTGQR